ncbi:MAG TPA: SDR family NAD(P)-dependent oxidoreductase [Nocardioides sp.]|jgi:NAD(P)-dependent dehydrogenase (short-subunit alcohol dehydrogenase family)
MANSQQAVLVTGAAGGIGSAVVRALSERGHRVFAGVRRDAGELARLPGVEVVRLDVTDPDSVAAAARTIGQALDGGGLRAVVNNAGLIVQGPLELIPPDQLRHQFEVNTLGPTRVTQEFLPLLRDGAGRVVNVSAPTARVPIPLMAPIAASKAALASLSECQRMELAAWSIPVVLVEPGATETAIFDKAATRSADTLAGADPAKLALYADHLAAFDAALARQKNGPVAPVARAIVSAVEARRPRRRYVAGSGSRMLATLSHLPTGLRERLIAGAFGMNGIRPAVTATR